MVTMDQMKDGVIRFLDTEIIPQMGGLRKLAFSTYIALAADGLAEKLVKMKDSTIVAATGLIHEDGMIDVDKLYTTLCDKLCEDVALDVPMIGRLSFTRSDLDRCYHMIVGSE